MPVESVRRYWRQQRHVEDGRYGSSVDKLTSDLAALAACAAAPRLTRSRDSHMLS